MLMFDFMFQLNAPFLYYIYHISLHVSSNFMLVISRIHCIHTASGHHHHNVFYFRESYKDMEIVIALCMSLFLGERSVHGDLEPSACALSGHLRRVTYKEPDAVCIQ